MVLLNSLLLGKFTELQAANLILNIAIIFLEFAVLHDLADQVMKLFVLYCGGLMLTVLQLLLRLII